MDRKWCSSSEQVSVEFDQTVGIRQCRFLCCFLHLSICISHFVAIWLRFGFTRKQCQSEQYENQQNSILMRHFSVLSHAAHTKSNLIKIYYVDCRTKKKKWNKMNSGSGRKRWFSGHFVCNNHNGWVQVQHANRMDERLLNTHTECVCLIWHNERHSRHKKQTRSTTLGIIGQPLPHNLDRIAWS